MVTKYTVVINGFDLTNYVERDSYQTALIPVESSRVTTMDGVDHVHVLRHKGQLVIGLNPIIDRDLADFTDAVMVSPMTVQYHNIQKNEVITSQMTLDTYSAQWLSRCLFRGEKWNQTQTITFTEL